MERVLEWTLCVRLLGQVSDSGVENRGLQGLAPPSCENVTLGGSRGLGGREEEVEDVGLSQPERQVAWLGSWEESPPHRHPVLWLGRLLMPTLLGERGG